MLAFQLRSYLIFMQMHTDISGHIIKRITVGPRYSQRFYLSFFYFNSNVLYTIIHRPIVGIRKRPILVMYCNYIHRIRYTCDEKNLKEKKKPIL